MNVNLDNIKEGFKAEYFKELSELESGNFWFRSRNKLILWALHKYVPLMKSFLEIGCGTGFVISQISEEYPFTKISGSELLAEGLIYARKRVPRGNFMKLDACNLSIKSGFDVIGIFDVLEHIEKDEIVLAQINKALIPNGYVFITVPQHKCLWSVVDEYACHVRRYSKKDLHNKLSKHGFEILLSTSFVSLLLPAMLFSRLTKRRSKNIDMNDIDGLYIHPFLNKIFELIMGLEVFFIRLGIIFPVGGSRIIVARKL